jgi:hypothetical protein
VDDDVADGVEEIESMTMDRVEVPVVRRVVVGVGTAIDLDSIVEVVLGALLATTVRTLLVGITASCCPRHTLYAEAAPWSTMEQPVYTQPRATSPSDSPLLL